MPTPAPVPPSGLKPVQLPRSDRVLLLVDFINPLDFPGGEHLAPPAVAAARATAGLKQRLTAEGVVTIFANDNYGVWHSDFHSMVATCVGMEGPAGEIARLLYPQAGDLAILKPRHSAFFASPLDLLLTGMRASELVICGLATDICVQLTAGDAFLREYRLWVPSDCTAAESEAAKAASLAYMANVFKCDTARSTRARRARGAGSARA
ncbi:isochorismatase family cysteine hydrolase [Ramlibacter sp.]|uniref:cysteine hydrolase family protein n=1 Tax=Ramlibacter sp. TaxID=1917967 RepID=UPI002BF9F117|nr:isochorismatase family cysteine hydrolase [Ramlibacter sp.]HWI81221.1 isochorismatase family cysteine hydrolase [Ramlibacter sp.]